MHHLIEPNLALKPMLKAVHYRLNMGMAALVFMHVAAALTHLAVDRDGITQRMLPFATSKRIE